MTVREAEVFRALLEERLYHQRKRPRLGWRSLLEEIAIAEECLARARFVAHEMTEAPEDLAAAQRMLVKTGSVILRALSNPGLGPVPTREQEEKDGHVFKRLLARMVQIGQEGR